MADTGLGSLGEGLGQFGKLFEEVFKNEYASFFIVLIILSILFATILKRLVGKIPIFEGGGDLSVNAQGNVVSWCISLLCVLSIGWMTKDQGPSAIVGSLVGPWGYLIVIIMTMLLAYSVYNQTDNMQPWARRAWTLGIAIPFYIFIGTPISQESTVRMMLFILIGVIVFGLVFATDMWGRR